MILQSRLRDGLADGLALVGAAGWRRLEALSQTALIEMEYIGPEHDSGAIDDDGIAHVYIQGLLGRNLTDWDHIWGATDYRDIEEDIMGALDGGARALALHVNSPGGLVDGVEDVAELISTLDIPTLAWVDTQAASAAYWLASGADIIAGPRGASYGSIGAYIPYIDASRAWDSMGLRFAPVVSEGSDLKLAGAGPSMTDDQREHLQATVDGIMAEFRGHVEAYRSPGENVWRGGLYRGAQAVELGLADVVGSYADALDMLLDEIG
jgi:ClpP class serine protease